MKMRNWTREYEKFFVHRWNAKRRGIPFLLTFDEWWKIWQDSGKWNLYGRHKGQYCMARFKDKGAYEIGNVRICLNAENFADRNLDSMIGNTRGKTSWLGLTPEQRAARIAVLIERNKQGLSLETRAKISAAKIGRRRVIRVLSSRPHSAEHKAKMSAAFKGRHWVLQDGQRKWL